jgi:hypothetical protein
MSSRTPSVKLVFLHSFDDLAAHEARDRGHLSHVSVEFADGSKYPVIFYDPVRLKQDLEEMTKLGHPCLGDPGMIVIPEVTMEYMNAAITILAQEGYFSYLQQLNSTEELDPATTLNWPP